MGFSWMDGIRNANCQFVSQGIFGILWTTNGSTPRKFNPQKYQDLNLCALLFLCDLCVMSFSKESLSYLGTHLKIPGPLNLRALFFSL